MPAFQPTGDRFRAFRDDPHDGPIVQVNLLKFRVKAAYGPDGSTELKGLGHLPVTHGIETVEGRHE